jgi:hypothetical protein
MRASLPVQKADRPRSEFWSVRREIDYVLPDAIPSYLRDPG